MKIEGSGTGPIVSSSEANVSPRLTDAAQQFEAMLLQELLKPFSDEEDGLDGEKPGGASDTLRSFGTEAVAKAISRAGGLGIAKQITRQVSAEDKMSKTDWNSTKV